MAEDTTAEGITTVEGPLVVDATTVAAAHPDEAPSLAQVALLVRGTPPAVGTLVAEDMIGARRSE